MKLTLRVASAAALVVVPGLNANAQKVGKALAMDFRTTIQVQGMPDTAIMTGHAVGSADKMRIDVKATGSRVTPMQSDSIVTMILTDSGKTITYIDASKSQYMRVRPAEMVAQAQQMSGMKMDFSGTQATVADLG